ncbi:MAG: carboxypeptidase regulatory-like domain-containing protein [Candidatus Cloacimonetes bacterium]|nr:carboxypeptidase regulatory-like domain-containing protein [Candidatus Cloacimonadota bacterium]
MKGLILLLVLLFTFPLVAQTIDEGFETGDFSTWAWLHSGSANWSVTPNEAYEGSFSAQSGTISHNQTSTLSIDVNVASSGDISFYWRVSSEATYDFLRFYIDGMLVDQCSGTQEWLLKSYPVGPGLHTFGWRYYKDGSVSHGSDKGWIDNITFPPNSSATDVDFGAILVAGPSVVQAGESINFDITLKNFGSQLISSYEFKLMRDNDIELATLTLDNNVAPGAEITHFLPWVIPANETTALADIYAVGIIAGDEDTSNDACLPITVLILDQNTQSDDIASADISSSLFPLNFNAGTSLTQMLLYPDEIGSEGELARIALYNNFNSEITDTPLRIWAGITEEVDLYAGWIPATDMQLVYDDLLTFPAGENMIIIDLEHHTYYHNGESIALMFERPLDSQQYGNNKLFYIGTDITHQARTRYWFGEDTAANPGNPPDDSVLMNIVPAMTLFFQPFDDGAFRCIVKDVNDYPISDAQVLLVETAQTATTDSLGICYFTEIAAGDYSFVASLNGFQDDNVDGIAINIGNTVDVNFVLEAEAGVNDADIPHVTTQLLGNYPNPFNPETEISFSLAEQTRVQVEIFNARGQKVATLTDSQYQPGQHSLIWNAQNASSGIYFCKLKTPAYTAVQPMTLIK